MSVGIVTMSRQNNQDEKDSAATTGQCAVTDLTIDANVLSNFATLATSHFDTGRHEFAIDMASSDVAQPGPRNHCGNDRNNDGDKY